MFAHHVEKLCWCFGGALGKDWRCMCSGGDKAVSNTCVEDEKT